ncbi:Bifunctional oligoribonuclease and PAP phosphatase NrnA [Geobacillus sp. BCO2]|nr:Bifunctional oligoribonuclease and PAP phosphatase NrnA [Geobacillus sp. BCO2]
MDVIDDGVYEQALVIVCDTANEERICDSRYRLGRKLIKIDHHPNDTPYGDMMWVDTAASSTSEMIYEFYLAGKEEGLTMTAEAARLIYAGIVGDTGRFLFPRTSEKTFRYAGELISYGFFADGIVRRIVSDELAARPLKRLCAVELYDRGRGGGCENAAGAA